MTLEKRYDAIIGGGGPAGIAMALALAHVFQDDVRVALVDPAVQRSGGDDPRAWALSAASVRLLEVLGVWPAVVAQACPVTEIDITDSPLEAGIRPVLLSYDNRTSDGATAAHIVPNQALLDALQAAVIARPPEAITVVHASIASFEADASAIVAALDDRSLADRSLSDLSPADRSRDGRSPAERSLAADLIIAADGRNSQLREMAGIKTVQWPYPQLGIVTTVSHERPNGGRAVQHFLPGGPFAILPLQDNRSCITWSEDAATARSILALDDAAFLAEVKRRFGGKLGLLELAGPRASFPLAMHLARSFIAPRLALIGDAAHGVHPIAGQGLNLALRDVAALSECIADGVRGGLSAGDPTILERYQSWRRFDATLSTGAFDAINRLFSNDATLLRSVREVGLGLVDRMPPLKRFLVEEAAGLSGDLPKLMR